MSDPGTNASSVTAGSRIDSVDVIRGLVCVLMAIDHVRVYSGIPAGGPTPGIFLTRWITHFVAPAFCFLAGTSAFLHGRKLGDLGRLSKFLVTRGLLLVILELTLIRLLWGFHVSTDFALAGVIWMLGWCMVLLGLVVRIPARTIGWLGIGIMALQQLFNLPPRAVAAIAPFWSFIYNTPAESAPLGINVLYVLVPWAGMMMAGYGFGMLFDRDVPSRHRLFTRTGLGMTAAWIVIATAVALLRSSSGGEVAGEQGAPPVWMQVLNQQKYPASQLFILMTLGPAIALLPLAERKGVVGRVLATIGRVPMFFYLMHILVIHLLAMLTMRIRFGDFDAGWYATAPYTQIPPDHRWSLSLLYLVWAVAIVVLYVMCRWYAARKRDRPSRWMAYL